MDELERREMDGQLRSEEADGQRRKMQAGREQFLHALCTVQLLNGFESQTTEYLVSQCVTEREITVVRRREKETQMEKGGSDGITGELIEDGLDKHEQSCSCAH